MWDGIDELARSIDLFLGQGDKPMTCAADGGVYLIEELAAGNTIPWRVPGATVEDVRACSFDTGSQNVLLLTEDQGLLRVDPAGQVTMVDLAIRGESAFFGE